MTVQFPKVLQPIVLNIDNPYDTFSKNLRARLKYSGIPLHLHYKADSFSLMVKENKVSEKILTIATNTRIRQVELTYSLKYSLLAPSEEVILKERGIEVSKIHNENLDNLLGTHHDRQLIEEEMKQNAISILLNQINSKESQSLIHHYFQKEHHENKLPAI